ncbi:MAG: hypothetical protein U0172_00805 [Nitrospiraceae bacterium]
MSNDERPQSGFAAFLPPEYQGEFSREWIMGLSPFDDQTCRQCWTVQGGQWIEVGDRPFDESSLTCDVRYRLV